MRRKVLVAICMYSSFVTRMRSMALARNPVVQETFDRLHHGGSVLLLDGGTGEELFRQGVPDDRTIWSATAVVHPQHHEVLKQVHKSFVDAGSKAITTNSYGIVPGVGFSQQEILQHVAEAGRLARESLSSDESCSSILVLGSLGPLMESYRPDKVLPHNEGVRFYKLMVEALDPYVDCFLAETMSSYEESIQAVEAVCNRKPMLVSYTLNSNGSLRSGEVATSAILKLVAFAKQHNTELLGVLFNCAEPEAITNALQQLHQDPQLRGMHIGAYANRLTPIAQDWELATSEAPQEMRTDLTPEQYYSDFVSKWVNDYGASIIGGCCGITPEHIAYLHSHLPQDQT